MDPREPIQLKLFADEQQEQWGVVSRFIDSNKLVPLVRLPDNANFVIAYDREAYLEYCQLL